LHRPAVLALAVAFGLAGCAGLPDQRLANEALKSGNVALAQQNYQQLANLGYADAQVGLADIWVESGDPAQLAKAEAAYRAAAATSPRAAARLGKLLAAKPNSTEAERHEAEGLLKQSFNSGEGGTLMSLALLYIQYPQSFPKVNAQQKINEWKAAGYPEAGLAQIILYRVQNTYDQNLAEVERICKAALDTSDICYVELATVYQKQNRAPDQTALVKRLQDSFAAGRVQPARVDAVARILANPDLGTPDPKTAQALLESATASYPGAYISLAQLQYDFPDLGDTDQLMGYIDKGHDADPSRAELLLGKIYYEGKVVLPDAAKSEEHLKKAIPDQVSAYYYLGQIYRRGYLGKVESQKAVDNLLVAARRGQVSADFALAQLYFNGRGTLPNPVNAYVFSQLAKNQTMLQPEPRPEILELAKTVEEQLPPQMRAQAQQLLQQETAARGPAPGQAATTIALHDDAAPETDAVPQTAVGEDEDL
jgi:alginate biosynthesis protein AlgK